jgi:Family of unknown function (DUF6174)
LTAVRQRWAAAGIRHYRMVVTANPMAPGWPTGLGCPQEVEVRDEQVVRVERGAACEPIARLMEGRSIPNPPTVTALFAEIEEYARGAACGAQGCRCGVMRAEVEYDRALGYPLRIMATEEPSAPVPCPPVALRIRLVVVSSFTPLP